jgi:arylsulfatase A-like enzyme
MLKLSAVRSLVALVLCMFALTIGGFANAAESKPNILLIVADDMGYADLGQYGGEIRTPHLDALAKTGLSFTNFYASPTCSTTRAMLLTGTDNHVAGLGNMNEWLGPAQQGKQGYEGHLNERVVTISTLMRDAGYHTYMAGKWHLGEEEPGLLPAARGFERDLSVLQGAGSHWSDMQGLVPQQPKLSYTKNGERLSDLPENFFSSKNFTDFIINSIEEDRKDGKPFFAYLAFQAPHGPLAVPDEWRDKYQGQYDKGYDEIRKSRLASQKQLGIVRDDTVAFPRLPNIPAWDDLTSEQRRRSARKMELYAAMVENMDHHIGRLLEYLRKVEKLDNTLIIFLSDNGAAGQDIAELLTQISPQAKTWLEETFDNSYENWGRQGSLVDYGASWAQVGMVPFRQFKGVLAEGGIRMPLIVSGPGVKPKGKVNNSLLHVMDIMPTLLELTGEKYPQQHNGNSLAAIQGKSMAPLLAEKIDAVRGEDDWLGWELFGNRAIRQGDWKLLSMLKKAGGTGDWQLFNLREDPAELHDLSKKYPERREMMKKLWEQYATSNGVIAGDAGPFAEAR